MVAKRAAGFLIFRRLNQQIEYLLLRASYGSKHWTPPKGTHSTFHTFPIGVFRNGEYFNQLCLSISLYGSIGHVDPGEDDFTTALRETQEEAGYLADDLIIHKDETKILEYKVKGKDKIVVYWLAELRDATKNPKLSHEHIEFRWLTKDAAIALSGFQDFANMVQHFDERIKNL